MVRLLDNKVTLSQHQRLLAVSRWLALLLSALHYDLKDRETAYASREAAYQFGREAGDNEVVSWSFETLAWFALADNNFRKAIGHARAGQAVAPSKTSASVSTTMQEVRATARLGDRVATERALLRADAALERMAARSIQKTILPSTRPSCPSTRPPPTFGLATQRGRRSTPAESSRRTETPRVRTTGRRGWRRRSLS